MATGTWTVSKQYMVSSNTGDANPGDLHVPIGLWPSTGWKTRAVLYAPVSFSGMTGINSARLYLKAHAPSSGWHANGSSTASIYTCRKTADFSETSYGVSSAVNELWSSVGAASIVTASYVATQTGDFANVPDMTDGTWYSIPITNIVQDWFNGSPNYGIMIYNATSETNSSYAKEFYSRHSSGNQPYIWIDYATNTAPNAPTNLSPTGSINVHTGTSVTLSGTRSDPDSGDYLTAVDIYVYDDASGAQVYHSTPTYSGTPSTFSVTATVPSGNKFYNWKARTRDRQLVWGSFSALQRFQANTPPLAPTISITQTPITSIKTLTPTINVTFNDPDEASGDTHTSYQIIVTADSSGATVWDSGTLAASGADTVNKVYNGPALSWQTGYRVKARSQDSNGAWGPYSSTLYFGTYTTHEPTNLDPSGVVGDLTPTFTGNRALTSDTIVSYEILVYLNDATTLKWNSGVLTSGITSGASFSKDYNGAALSYNQPYYWTTRITGAIGGTSQWSAMIAFSTPASNAVTQTAPKGTPVTTLTPTFTGSWSDTFNAYQIILYAADGVTQIWDSTLLSVTAASTYSKLYNGPALSWNTQYKWKIRVRRSADSVVQPYSGLIAFTTDSAGTPTLTAPINDSWQTTTTPTFTGTTFGGETINTYRIQVYESDGTTLTWDSGNLSGSGTSFSKVYNGSNALVGGRSYKWQASYVKTGGASGNFSTQGTFHVNGAPLAPTNLTPGAGAIVGTLLPAFTATFEDSDKNAWGDVPTKLEVEISNNTTGTVIGTITKTTGLTAGGNTATWGGSPALAYETVYRWRARYTDSKSSVGTWSSYVTFKPSQPSSMTLISPTSTIVSPSVPIQWSFSSPGGKPQANYQVVITLADDGSLVYDSGVVVSSDHNHTVPAGFLVNNTAYNFVITALDTDGI